MHFGIAFGATYAQTGDVAMDGAVTVVEPVCNTGAHRFFDRWWERLHRGAPAGAAVAVGAGN